MAEELRALSGRPWPIQFKNGGRSPSFGWGGLLGKAYEESLPVEQRTAAARANLVAVVIGDHEQNVDHTPLGRPKPPVAQVAEALGRLARGEPHPLFPNSHEVFGETYEKLANSPGVGILDILIVQLGDIHTENRIAHLGQTPLQALTTPLSRITEELLVQAGLEIPDPHGP